MCPVVNHYENKTDMHIYSFKSKYLIISQNKMLTKKCRFSKIAKHILLIRRQFLFKRIHKQF